MPRNRRVGKDDTLLTVEVNTGTSLKATASYAYDNNGNTTTKTEGSAITTFSYNATDRLQSVNLPDGRTATYSYDPFGRRIKKQVGTETTIFVYADEGLIGEYTETGATKKIYGWRPDGIWGTNPLFMTEGETYYFYHNDHLGTPQSMTDAAGDIVWEAAYEAFGKATVDPESTITNNLRFPGQYWDEETGLHYNFQRYYDPTSGRYVSVDPIGFAAGDANYYVYVGNDALNSLDPDGLAAQKAPCKYRKCVGEAWFSAVGPNQALSGGALGGFGISPDSGTVAVNPEIFGLPYGDIKARLKSQKVLAGYAKDIKIIPEKFSIPGAPDGPYTVSDIGDKNIRASKLPRFDIYRFKSQKEALRFGKQKVKTTIILPDIFPCPLGFKEEK